MDTHNRNPRIVVLSIGRNGRSIKDHHKRGFAALEGLEPARSRADDGSIARPRHSDYAGRRSKEHRRQLTVSEARLWSTIKAGATGARFRRQVPIGRWIADFACLDPPIVIEVDDESHEWRDETERTAFLEEQGFTLIRFDNEHIAKNVEGAFTEIQTLVRTLGKRRPERPARPKDR